MAFESSPLAQYLGTFSAQAVPLGYEVKAELITPEAIVPVGLVTAIHETADYEKTIGLEQYISIRIPPSRYMTYVLPFQQQLKVRVMIRPYALRLRDKGKVESIVSASVYRAVCLTTFDSNLASNDERTASKGTVENKDEENMIDLQFQIYDPVLEYILQAETGSPYTGTLVKDLLRLEFGRLLQDVEIDTGFKMQGVEVVDPDNDVRIRSLHIPHGTSVLDLADYIQNQVGVYATDIGVYYRNPNLFIYPLYDETHFEDPDRKKLVIYNYPADKYPGLETTWLDRKNYVEVACTRSAMVADVTNTSTLIGNAGGRFISAKQMSEGMTFSKDGETVIARPLNTSEYVTYDRKDGVNVAKGMGKVTNNRWRELSATASQRGRTFQVLWEHANPELLLPGMPTKVIWMDKGVLKEAVGVLLKADSMLTMAGTTPLTPRWTYNTSLTVWLAPEEENTNRPTSS